MPACKTCQGEYVRQECLCPSCEQPLGRGAKACHRCGAETGGKRLCPRCRSDVSAWEAENFSLVQFIYRWGALGLFPSLIAMVLWLVFWYPRPDSLHHPVITLVAVALSQLVLVILYVTRLSWREQWWASQIYRTMYPPLTLSITGTFIVGIVLAVGAFAMHRLWKPPFDFGQQLVFGAAYAPAFVFITIALTLVAIHDYVDRLNQRVPQPLFVHTDRLLRVAVDTALQSLNVLDEKRQGAARQNGYTYKLLEIVRFPEDGGIRVLLHEYRQAPHESEPETGTHEEKVWHIEADRWGRLRSLKPGILKGFEFAE